MSVTTGPIADDIAAALPELRGQAESLMVESWEVTRPGAATMDPDTDQVVREVVTVRPAGRGRTVRPLATASDAAAGGDLAVTGGVMLVLPWDDDAAIRPGDTARCTASPVPSRVGMTLAVRLEVTAPLPVERRIACEMVSDAG